MKYSKKAISQTSEALVENSIDLIELDQRIHVMRKELLILEEQRDSILYQMRTYVSVLRED